jgi:hypothetical protein
MKIADLLRTLADQLDGVENTVQQDAGDESAGDNEVGVFVSPLQQELELKKKEQGVENIFDEPDHSAADDQTNQPDELEVIKRNAGIQ